LSRAVGFPSSQKAANNIPEFATVLQSFYTVRHDTTD
jgi:hypothetical protein